MKRIITGTIIGAVWLTLLFYAPYALFWLFTCLVGLGLLTEYFSAIFSHDLKKNRYLCIGLGLFPLLASFTADPEMINAAFIIALLAGSLMLCLTALEGQDLFVLLSQILFGMTFIGFFAAHLTLIRTLDQGVYWLLFLSGTIIASDTGAFYTGSFIGKIKLCPAISPGKTVEGLVGGIIWATTTGVVIASFLLPQVAIAKAAIIAVILTLVGVLGDLTESIFKRSLKIKDSSDILPGHGGLLDRLDSLLMTSPVLFYMLKLQIV